LVTSYVENAFYSTLLKKRYMKDNRGRIELPERRGRRRNQILDVLKKIRGY
jgi:hypothetical protein